MSCSIFEITQMNSTSKQQLRNILLEYRRKLDVASYKERNEQLCHNVLTFIEQGNFKAIHTFLPIERNKEPDMQVLFTELRNSGRTLVTSVTNFKEKSQKHFYLKAETPLVNNHMGIPEPVDAEEADAKELDLILIPLLAADKRGNRIGYGGGYYDRLLKETNATKVGLSLAPPMDEIVQAEEWDVALDKVITPFG